nr:DAK2 domain-containing protein [Anaerolineae bacterium]
VVENMQIQYEQQLAKRMRKEAEEAPPVVEGVAVITVAAGDGIKRAMMRDLGAAYVISGGQTMNPSAEDFLNAINSIPNTEIVLLPNNSNIILTAKQAAQMAQNKRVTVVPSKTLPQGVSALIAYGNAHGVGADLDDITAEMRDALSIVRTIEVTTSTRAISMDGVTTAEGQIIGLLDDKLASSGESIEDVVHEMLMLAQADRAELITVYYGWDVREAQANKMAEQVRERFDHAEIQVVRGGQPLYPYIISVE